MLTELIKIFPNFPSQLIQEMEEKTEAKIVEPQKIIIRSGQYIKSILLVIQGTVKVYREHEDGGEYFLYYLQSGQACAVSLLSGSNMEKSQIMAKVTEKAELRLVPFDCMKSWMIDFPSWYDFVFETLKNRFTDTLSILDTTIFRAMDERIEFYLKKHQDACNCVDINTSHQEIATELNTSRVVVSRLLKKLEHSGKIKLHRNHIELIK